MSDFTVNDTMAEIRYELDDREIYNDIRSEIDIMTTETVIDADPTYAWAQWHGWMQLPPDSKTYKLKREAKLHTPIKWKLEDHYANYTYLVNQEASYYDYTIKLVTTSDPAIVWVEAKNTGSKTCYLHFTTTYKYVATEGATHEEIYSQLLQVRATDSTSIQKYGRRVMNLTWAEGTERKAMQSLVNYHLARYKDPVARLMATIKGSTDALRTQIITREISDLITVVCTNLGLNADCFINSISISDSPVGIPACVWGLEIQRAYELLTLFLLDTSELDGSHILAS